MTTADINNTLSLQTQFTVGNTGTPPPDTVLIRDRSVWTSIVSASTDKVNIILQIKNSAGQVIYQNAGWVAGAFGSPDLFFGTSPVTTTSAKTLLYDANSDLITGTYTVQSQVQVVQNYATTPIITLGGLTYNPLLCADYLQANLNPSLTFAENCNSANMTVSDSTAYGAYTSITRTIKVTPPVETAQSPFTNSSNSVLITSLWSPAPYQGEIHNVVTYGISTAQVITISYINYFQNFDTNCDQSFCELYCCLKDLYVKREALRGKNQILYAQVDQQFSAGLQILALCYQARDCSDEVRLATYISQFYIATGCDNNCSCGCSDTPSPVVPVSPSQGPAGADGVGISTVAINGSNHLIITLTDNTVIDAGAIPAGTNGTNGATWRFGSGVPSNSLGVNGDLYIDTATNNYYAKVSGAYVLQGNLGGTNGTTEFWNPLVLYTNTSGTGNAHTETIPANSVQTIGDEIKLCAYLSILINNVGVPLHILVGGLNCVTINQSSTSISKFRITVKIIYSASNTITRQFIVEELDLSGYTFATITSFGTTLSFDPTVDNDVVVSFPSFPDNSIQLGLLENEIIKV